MRWWYTRTERTWYLPRMRAFPGACYSWSTQRTVIILDDVIGECHGDSDVILLFIGGSHVHQVYEDVTARDRCPK